MPINIPPSGFVVKGRDLGIRLYTAVQSEIEGRFTFAIISRHARRLEDLESQILIAEAVPGGTGEHLEKVIAKLCRQFMSGCPTGTIGVIMAGNYWIAVHGAPQGGVREASLKIATIINRLVNEPSPEAT